MAATTPFERQIWSGATKDTRVEKMLGNDNMMAWSKENTTADDRFDYRDNFTMSSPANTSPVAREGIETENVVDKNEIEFRDIMDTIRSKNESPSQMKKIIPPDPIGDTISQKMRENQTSKQDPPLKAMNDSLLEWKNKIYKLSQDKERVETEEISEELLYETDEIDDDLSLRSEPIDLTAICDPAERNNRQQRSKCAESLKAQLQRNGFAMVCGTSISRFICRDALYACHLLLCEADEYVRTSCQSKDGNLRGYAPRCTERSSSSGLKDKVRKFRLGSKKGNTPNIWPVVELLDEESSEYIQASFQEYHDNLYRVAVSITKSLQEILANDTGDSHIIEPMRPPYAAHDPNSSLVTVFNCERGSRHDTRKPLIVNHNDTSLVTILLVDGGDCANIQHKLIEGEWESVRLPNVIPTDPVFMVYAGENLQKFTSDLITSPSRRIIPSSGDESMNGLFFSLMPSDGHANPSMNEKPTQFDVEELPNPISKLGSELNSIDEMFRSFVFAEDGDLQQDSDLLSTTATTELTDDTSYKFTSLMERNVPKLIWKIWKRKRKKKP